jgi:hypothetical protein
MCQNDTLQLGPFKYIVLQRVESMVLLGWRDSMSHIEKTMWVNLKHLQGVSK